MVGLHARACQTLPTHQNLREVLPGMAIQVDKATIEFLGEKVDFFDKPLAPNEDAPQEQIGSLQKFRVTTLDTLNMVFGIVFWPAANPEVRFIEFIDGLGKYERLENAGRWSLFPAGGNTLVGELNVMKYGNKGRPTLHGAEIADLDTLTKGSFASLMTENGALAIGERQDLDGTSGRNSRRLAVKIEASNREAIAIAFTVTRVLAIMNDFGL